MEVRQSKLTRNAQHVVRVLEAAFQIESCHFRAGMKHEDNARSPRRKATDEFAADSLSLMRGQHHYSADASVRGAIRNRAGKPDKDIAVPRGDNEHRANQLLSKPRAVGSPIVPPGAGKQGGKLLATSWFGKRPLQMPW